ncbi:MAG: zf-TFIIB domain-containing protein [Pseudomonadota bacterium]
MPLLLCPNDNGSMQTVQRSGVEFDICPTCRGVWLDRGELEKLLAVARQHDDADPVRDRERPSESGHTYRQPARSEGRRGWDDDDDDYRRKKRRSSIFDIFD